jgi:hypothetical protein
LGLLLATTTFAVATPQVIKLVINGKEIHPDVAPQIINGRVMVPARFVAEPLGATVEWDDANKTVLIFSKSVYADDVNPKDWITIRDLIEQFPLTDEFILQIQKRITIWERSGEKRGSIEINNNLIRVLKPSHLIYLNIEDLKNAKII